ncbi:MAG: phenylalanyl-tRNA synthetase beta chain, partial [Patescibacteria group bacterium]|nr:phenylalanyl-tRNA synthetase beta chain [Patescibacteria group bacterium]
MNVSLNYIKDNLGFDVNSIGLEDLTKRVGSQLGAIEDVIKVAPKWRGAVVAKVVLCQQHPNADKLHVCLVDDGGVIKDVQRNDDGLVTVVCGAPNVHDDMLVVWLPPGATVPATYSDKEPFVLSPKELRGTLSNGMLASPSELGLSNDHDGILELTNKDFANLPTPGTLFVDLLGLNDVVLDLENKMFTHRPDCFGHIGVARELAGISGQAFKSPEWYLNKVNLPDPKDVLGLNIQNQALEVVPRFMMQAISNIKVGPSPLWLQAFLARIGQKSVNNI